MFLPSICSKLEFIITFNLERVTPCFYNLVHIIYYPISILLVQQTNDFYHVLYYNIKYFLLKSTVMTHNFNLSKENRKHKSQTETKVLNNIYSGRDNLKETS